MLYMPKIANYLKVLTDEEVTDFVDINFVEQVSTNMTGPL